MNYPRLLKLKMFPLENCIWVSKFWLKRSAVKKVVNEFHSYCISIKIKLYYQTSIRYPNLPTYLTVALFSFVWKMPCMWNSSEVTYNIMDLFKTNSRPVLSKLGFTRDWIKCQLLTERDSPKMLTMAVCDQRQYAWLILGNILLSETKSSIHVCFKGKMFHW